MHTVRASQKGYLIFHSGFSSPQERLSPMLCSKQRASAQAAQQGRQRIDDALAWPELALEETVYGKVQASVLTYLSSRPSRSCAASTDFVFLFAADMLSESAGGRS